MTGFAKAYKRERGDALVKAVDFEVSRKTADPADALIAETLSDPGVVEVGYYDGNRYSVTLVEQPAADGAPGLTLGKDTVFLVTGAAGGITSAIVGDLAAASGGIFYLLDLVSAARRERSEDRAFPQRQGCAQGGADRGAQSGGRKPDSCADRQADHGD